MLLLPDALKAARLLTGERDAEISVPRNVPRSSAAGARAKGNADAEAPLAPIRHATQVAHSRLDGRLDAYMQAACLDASILAVQLPSPPPVVIGAGPRTPAQETAEGEDDVSHGMIHAQLRTGLASLHSLRAIGDALEAAAATRGPTPAHGAGPRAGPNQRRGIEGDPSEAPILGSADRRTLNMLISIVNQWALDLVASLYDRASAATRAFTQRSQHIGASVYEIGSATDPYTRLRDISVAAGQALQMFAHAAQVDVEAVTAAAQAGKPAPPQPPVRGQDEQHGGEAEEPVSSLVLRSCAAPLFRLAFRVAFDTSPVGPAPGTGTHGGTHLTAPSRLAPAQVANALLKTALRRLSVLQCYAALSGVTARVHGGQPVRGLADAPNAGQLATPVPPPPGAAAHASRFLSAQLLRPGGVRAMLSIMLLRPVAGARAAGNPPPTPHHAQVPEHAQSDVSDAVLEHEVDPAPSPAKVQRVVSLLSTPPPRLPMSHWLGAVVPQLLDLVTDAGAHLLLASVPRTARGTEDVHAATALTALQHLASLHPDVYTYLSNRLVFPFNPLTEIQLSPPQAPKLVSVSAVTLSLQTLLALLTLGPPDPTFLNTVLDFGHRVKPLLHLAGFLRQLRQDKASAPPPTAKVQDVVSSPSALAIDAAALAESVQFALGRWCSTRSADQHDDILSTLGPQPGGALSPSSVRLTDLPDTWSWGLEDDHLFVCKVAVDFQEEEASVLASLLSQLSTQEEKLNVQGRPGAATHFDPIRMFLPALQVVVDLLDQVQAQDVERVSSFSKSKSTPLDTLLKLLLMELLRVQRSRHTSISERLAHSAVLLQGITLVLPRATPSLYIDHALPVLLFIDYALDGTMGNPERDPELETEGEVEAGIGVEEHIRPVGKDESLESHAKAQAILATGMRPAAASLLVELLYNNTTLAVENTPLLGVVMDKLEALVQESRRSRRTLLNLDEDEPLSRVLPTLRLILRARSAGDYTPRPATDEEQNTPEHLVQQQYNESMALVQDPSIPVRGHGLVQLTQLVALNEVGASKTKKPLIIEVSDAKSEPKAALNPEQLEQVLNVFLAALDEEDSYVYMNAIKGLVQFALRPDGDEVFRRLIGMYVRGCPTPAPESTKTSTGGKWARNGRSKGNSSAPEAAPSPLGLHESVLFTAADVDRRLRVGETLGQVIQRMGFAVAPRIQIVVAPLLAFVRDAHVPTTLCVSTISLLGTLVEAAPTPVALSGTGHELAGLALGLLSLEGARATFRTSCTAAAPSVTGSTNVEDFRPDDKDEDETFELQDNPVSLDRSLPQLRRAAFLLLDLLLVGTESQLSSRYDSPLDISSGPTLSLPQKTEPALLPRLGPREDNRTLLDRVLITRIRHLAVFASSSEPDPVAQDLARSCVEQTDAIAAALAQG